MKEGTMSEETTEAPVGPRKRLSKSTAIAVMVAGGLMIVIPWFFLPAEQGSALQIVKTLVGVIGFVVLCVGAYYRP
jgi:VIT1/CCC1 family predicted Fe2+/Mn2+ transporter